MGNIVLKVSSIIFKDAKGITKTAEIMGDKAKITNKSTGESVTMELPSFLETLPSGLKTSLLERNPRVDEFISSKQAQRLERQIQERFGTKLNLEGIKDSARLQVERMRDAGF